MFKNIKPRIRQFLIRVFNAWQGDKPRILVALNLGVLVVLAGVAGGALWVPENTEALFSVVFALIMAHFVKVVSLLIRHGIVDYNKPKHWPVWVDLFIVLILIIGVLYLYNWAHSQIKALELDDVIWVGILAPMTLALVEGLADRFHKES